MPEDDLHEYELVVVIDPEIVEEDLPAAIERVSAAVTTRGGEIVDQQPWGRRRLAYPIRRRTEGNYVVSQIRLDPARAHEMESGFRISEEILRHLLIRKDEED
jgi:small subunit ribosomal protein S6